LSIFRGNRAEDYIPILPEGAGFSGDLMVFNQSQLMLHYN